MMNLTNLKKALSPTAMVVERQHEKYETFRGHQFAFTHGSEEEAKTRINPEVIIVPTSEVDIQKVLKFAQANNCSVVTRSGGHAYQATSSTSGERTIQVDMRNFNQFRLEKSAMDNTPENHAKGLTKDHYKLAVGPCIRLLEFSPILDRYNLFIPHGTCMDVNTGGHFQSSAMGLFTKSLGSGMEYVTQVKLILASGDIVIASKTHNADLFWALRGGSAGAFGVVLEYQMEALNAHNYMNGTTHAMRLVWEYSEEKARHVLTELFRVTSSKEYQTKRNVMLLILFHPKLEGGYMLSTDDEPVVHDMALCCVWNGVDNGSIHSAIPDDLLEEGTPSGTTFYQYYMEPFKHISGTRDWQCTELDGDNTLGRMAMSTFFGGAGTGSLRKTLQDMKISMRLGRFDTTFQDAQAEARAKELGIDMDKECIRHVNASRGTDTFEFDHQAFIDCFLKKCRFMEGNRHVGHFSQLTFVGKQGHDQNLAMPDSGTFLFDIWGKWRASAGEEVGKAVRKWNDEVADELTRIIAGNAHPDQAGMCHPAFASKGLVDISKEAVRRMYYPNDEKWYRLQVIKRKYDQNNIFRTKFSVPPVSDALWHQCQLSAPEMPILEGQATDLIHVYAGQNLMTLIGQMEHNALSKPNDIFLVWIDEAGKEESTSFRDFRDAVVQKASWLRHNTELTKGNRIILSFLPGEDFIVTLMACLYLGCVPVPVYPADLLNKNNVLTRKFDHIVKSVNPKLVLADERVLPYQIKASAFGQLLPTPGGNVPWVICGNDNRSVKPAYLSFDDEAIIQYTSGTTTGTPKGAIMTHGNLFSQFQIIHDSYNGDTSDISGFAWVPPYHDLGLFMAVLSSVMFGYRFTAMSPLAFLQRPTLWFSAISKYRVTHTAGPNFAYAHCLEKLRKMDAKDIKQIGDLSCLRSLGSGGEPIDHDTMESLLDLLSKHCNLCKSCFTPCYGLAEVGCAVTIEGKEIVYLEKQSLYTKGAIKLVTADQRRLDPSLSIAVYGCGEINNDGVCIVDEQGKKLEGSYRMGEIWISSPSLARKYIEAEHTPQLNRELASGEEGFWFASGDLGFVDETGELFVLGRKSDLVLVGEKQIFPHHIEAAVNKAAELLGGIHIRKGNTTAFLSSREDRGKLAIAIELRGDCAASVIMKNAVAKIITKEIRHQFHMDDSIIVHFLPQRSAIRTSSGKLERIRTGYAVENGVIKGVESYCTQKRITPQRIIRRSSSVSSSASLVSFSGGRWWLSRMVITSAFVGAVFLSTLAVAAATAAHQTQIDDDEAAVVFGSST